LVCFVSGFVAGFLSFDPITSWKLEKQYVARQEKFLNKSAPVMTTQTVDEASWSLLDHRGKVVVIDFWATWCGPCVHEIPELKELYARYKDRRDFALVGVSLDEDKNTLIEFCREKQIDWPQLHEPGKGWENTLARAFNVQGIPSVWLIDKQGNIAAFETSLSEIEKNLDRILSEQVTLTNTGGGGL
jgi:thiol-disulfide isomerase/thioredoxin